MRRQIANPNTFFVILAAFMLLAVQRCGLRSNGLDRPGYGRFSSCRRVVDR